MNLSKSEMDGLLALAAKTPLRGDRRTDAKAGTIHAPTAARLEAKRLATKRYRDNKLIGYVITEQGKAALPGLETLSASKEPEPVYPDRTPAVLVPASEFPQGKLRPNASKAERAAHAELAHEVIARQASKPLSSPSPKAKSKDAPTPNLAPPPILAAAFADVTISDRVLSATSAPVDVDPILKPNKPAPLRPSVVNSDAFEALCTTGSVVVELSDGRARINAVGTRNRGFEFWISRGKVAGWQRLPLGNAIAELDGAKVVDATPMPGKMPFAPIPASERERAIV
jgi:hypothetical protein